LLRLRPVPFRRLIPAVSFRWLLVPAVLLALSAVPGTVRAADQEQTEGGTAPNDGLEHLVPELADHPYTLSPGVKPFRHRIAFSPGFGWVGNQRLYTFRLSYNPNAWLGYEASLGHNPGQSVQALFHMLSAIVRFPVPGRFQPYGTVGYGMMLVFPGRTINADPVTENTLSYGGGLEFYVRNDLAVRAELRGLTVLGGARDTEGTVAYNYREATLGFAFYRELGK
jgi:opacity protein-like surface antigen